jgi:S-DNA-T family DNA segregation ATPase FtsK/SpoIIIE
MSLLYQNTAETLRIIMVDPKRVELTLYNGIPHLLTPVITNTNKTINALKWTVGEMERRFEVLSQNKSRDITSYNTKHPDDKIPHIVFVVDELADLMATAAGEVETYIIRLAQMARAVGIHLVLATQRPSVDVITGLMKANIPGRIAFSLPSLIDSRTILDTSGAEKLLGRGDMLYLCSELSKPVRIQGSFITEDEMKNVVDYLRGDEPPVYDESIVESQSSVGTTSMFGGPSDNNDALYNEAKKAIVKGGKASASYLQRKLSVGYSRAARILDQLEAEGVVGPSDGAKPREILITEAEIDDGKMEAKMTSAAHPKSLTVFEDEEDDEEEVEDDADDEEIDDEDDSDGDEIIGTESDDENSEDDEVENVFVKSESVI